MRLTKRGILARSGVAAGAVVAAFLLAGGSVSAQEKAAPDKIFPMKITLATLNDQIHAFVKLYAAALEKDSGGRIKPEVYPASQLGSIPRQIEGVQFGAIQCQVVPPEFLVGIDERFEVLTAPGLVASQEHGQRLAADPAVLKLMLALGADKGLHGVGLFMANPSAIIFKTPVRHLADFKGKKIRIFASPFQSVAMDRLGATPVAMSLADVLPALQQGAIDGAVASDTIFAALHYRDAAQYVTDTDQPAIFGIVEINKKWYDTLPPDLQKIVDDDAAKQSVAVNPEATAIIGRSRAAWLASGGEYITLPADEQAAMLKTLASVGADVAKTKPQLEAAYHVVTDAAQRTK